MTYHNEVQLVRHTEEVTNKLFIYIFKKKPAILLTVLN